MIFTAGWSRRISMIVSRPSLPGMKMSVRMRSTRSVSRSRVAAWPSPATVTAWPSPSSITFRISRMSGSSSTTRILAMPGAGGPAARSVPEVGAGIHGLALHEDLVVEVGPGGPPGVAAEPHQRAPLDPVARLHVHLGEMAVDAADVLAVVEDDGDAVLGLGARERDGGRGRRLYRRAALRADVEPAVELAGAGPGREPQAELGVDGAAHGPAR